ncbi:MAG: molecular chaperone DnaK, partial [Chloroflexota bacterium]
MAEARNQADSMIYVAEKSLREHGDRVPEHIRNDVNVKVEALRNVMNGEDIARIRRATEELSLAV